MFLPLGDRRHFFFAGGGDVMVQEDEELAEDVADDVEVEEEGSVSVNVAAGRLKKLLVMSIVFFLKILLFPPVVDDVWHLS